MSKIRSILSLLGLGLVCGTACHAVLGDYSIDRTGDGPVLSETVCDVGQYRCNGAWIFECNAAQDGWHQRSQCDSPERCSSERKRCLTCAPGEHRCNGSLLETCNSDQTGWAQVADCGSADACNLNSDTCRECVDGEYRCDGAQLEQCAAGAWQSSGDACASAELCAVSDDATEGKCVDPVCAAEGAHVCSGKQLLRCQPGQASTVLVEECDSAQLCDAAAADVLSDSMGASAIGVCQGGCQGDACFNDECGRVGRVECAEIELRKCTTSGWKTLNFCQSAALCNANDQRCEEATCTAGQGRCVGSQYEVCRDDRTGWDPAGGPCTGASLCAPDEGCVPSPCEEGAFRCNWTYLEQCITGGWDRVDRCGSPSLCSVATKSCAEPACGDFLGDFRCLGQSLQECNASRTEWQDLTTCPSDSACDENTGSCI